MASKANKHRTRTIRAAILSASMLSLVPLIGLMQSGESSSAVHLTASVDVPATTADVVLDESPAVAVPSISVSDVEAPASAIADTSVTMATGSTVAVTATKTTATQTTSAASYTRTKAS